MTALDEVVIGVDVGTSAVKVCAFGQNGQRQGATARELTTWSSAGARSEQDPSAVRAAVFGALRGCVAALDGAPVRAVALTTAMHALVGVDAGCEPITPLVTWADGRATDLVRGWRTGDEWSDVPRRTGVPLHPMAPLAKLAWFRAHEPTIWSSAHRWIDAKALTVAWLTGEATTEVSSASGWGLFDLERREWAADLLDRLGIDVGQLPAVESPFAPRALLPTVANDVGLPAGTPVVLGAADGPLANVGVDAMEPGVLGLSLGTSGALRRVVVDRPADDPSLFCYLLSDELLVSGGAVSNGADVVDWIAEALAPDWSELAIGTNRNRRINQPERAATAAVELAAAAPPGCDGLVMLPYLYPERAPLWDADLAGAYLGLRRHHTRADLARAAIEGVGLGLRSLCDRLAASHPVREIRATGGALRFPLWRDVLAASLGVPMTVVNTSQGSALGAAAVALVALGEADSLVGARGQLTDPNARVGEPVDVRPELAEAAARTRAALPELAAGVARSVAGLTDQSGASSGPR